MRHLRNSSRGFTLMELMVVVAILAVLMAIVAPAISGTKSQSVEGQVVSDGKATQTAVDNFGNKSIRTGSFPEAALSATTHRYVDVYGVGAGGGASVTLLDKFGNAIGSGETLATTIIKPGTTTTVPKRTALSFAATTDVYDADGSVKTASFVPDFLSKDPSSLSLKGDETKTLGATANTFEEYLWLMMVNAPGSSQESRVVQIFRMTSGTIALGAVTALTYTQVY